MWDVIILSNKLCFLSFCLVIWKRMAHSVNHVIDNSVYRAETNFAWSVSYRGVRGTVGGEGDVFFGGGGAKIIQFR